MEKYLYFRTVADVDGDDGDVGSGGAAADKSSACYPVSALLGMQAATATSLKFYFRGLQNTHGDASAANSDNKSDMVLVNVTAGRVREVMEAVIDKMNEPVSRDNGFIVVADDVTTALDNSTISAEYVSSHITSCGAIVIQDAQV